MASPSNEPLSSTRQRHNSNHGDVVMETRQIPITHARPSSNITKPSTGTSGTIPAPITTVPIGSLGTTISASSGISGGKTMTPSSPIGMFGTSANVSMNTAGRVPIVVKTQPSSSNAPRGGVGSTGAVVKTVPVVVELPIIPDAATLRRKLHNLFLSGPPVGARRGDVAMPTSLGEGDWASSASMVEGAIPMTTPGAAGGAPLFYLPHSSSAPSIGGGSEGGQQLVRSTSRDITLEEELMERLALMQEAARSWQTKWRQEREDMVRLCEHLNHCETESKRLLDSLNTAYSKKVKMLEDFLLKSRRTNELMVTDRSQLEDRLRQSKDIIDLQREEIEKEFTRARQDVDLLRSEVLGMQERTHRLEKEKETLRREKDVLCNDLRVFTGNAKNFNSSLQEAEARGDLYHALFDIALNKLKALEDASYKTQPLAQKSNSRGRYKLHVDANDPTMMHMEDLADRSNHGLSGELEETSNEAYRIERQRLMSRTDDPIGVPTNKNKTEGKASPVKSTPGDGDCSGDRNKNPRKTRRFSFGKDSFMKSGTGKAKQTSREASEEDRDGGGGDTVGSSAPKLTLSDYTSQTYPRGQHVKVTKAFSAPATTFCVSVTDYGSTPSPHTTRTPRSPLSSTNTFDTSIEELMHLGSEHELELEEGDDDDIFHKVATSAIAMPTESRIRSFSDSEEVNILINTSPDVQSLRPLAHTGTKFLQVDPVVRSRSNTMDGRIEKTLTSEQGSAANEDQGNKRPMASSAPPTSKTRKGSGSGVSEPKVRIIPVRKYKSKDFSDILRSFLPDKESPGREIAVRKGSTKKKNKFSK